MPCLRKLGMRFLAYNPLAGGLLAKLPDPDQAAEQGGRFDENARHGKMYRARYHHASLYKALGVLKEELGGIPPADAALRWLQHHSKLGKEDGVIIGGSSLAQIEGNCKGSEGGPLPEKVVKALDEACIIFKPDCPPYYR